MCLAVLCFSLLDSTAKYLGDTIGMPLEQVLWLRFLFHMVFLVLIYGHKQFLKGIHTNRPKLQFMRTIAMMITTAFNFLALNYLQLDQTITIFFLTPILVAIIAGPILGERLTTTQMLAVLFGFMGVLIAFRPGFSDVHWAVIFSLLSTLAVSIYNVLTRLSSRYDSNLTNQIYTPLGGMVFLMPFAFYSWQQPASLFIWILLISLGVTGGLAHWCLITAHRHAPAPLLAPFIYTGIITMPLIGYLVFDDIPSLYTLVGALFVIISGLYIWKQEKTNEGDQNKNADHKTSPPKS